MKTQNRTSNSLIVLTIDLPHKEIQEGKWTFPEPQPVK